MSLPSDPQGSSGSPPATDPIPGAAAAPGAEEQSETASALSHLAERLAAAYAQRGQQPGGKGRPVLLARLPVLAANLRAAYQAVLGAAAAHITLSYAAEWLLDNFYVVEQALHLIQDDLPEPFYRQLPVAGDADPSGATPRIYQLAHAFVTHEQCEVEIGQLQHFILAYQHIQPLTMGELWALPLMVRLSLLEQLAQGMRDLTERGQEGNGARTPMPGESEVVAAAIPSLRRLDSTDWKACFETISLVEQTLRQDPAQVYAAMDFPTRDCYRKIIEELAAGSRASELAIARHLLTLAQRSCPTHGADLATPLFGTRRYHVGYYLLGQGRAQLEQEIAYQARGLWRWRRGLLRRPTGVYLGGIALTVLLLLSMVAAYTARALPEGTSRLPWMMAVLFLALIPALTVAIALVNWILTNWLPARVLPKLEFSHGIPSSCRTMVVVPCLMSRTSDLDTLFRQMELHYLRNPDPALAFALLSDFADAVTQTCPEDELLLSYARAQWAALKARYPGAPFYFLHRRRLWNPSEQVWMGWERKRGKLHELNRLLRGARDTSYSTCLGDLEPLAAIRYVLTLDADTILPRDAARRLVGTLAHPLNQAVFADIGKGQERTAPPVVDGYTILQPRTGVQPVAANQSLFTRVFAADSGFDLYTLAVSDVYQDLFGTGIYVGKGLYDVDAFERSLHHCIPENTLLSHDLFEGIHGRVGLVSDIVLYEDYPPHYLINVRRSHRWVRGDWQLLPWLLGGHRGARQRRRLALSDSWKMLDNLRRSLLPPALLLLLSTGWMVLPGSPLVWTILTLLVPAVSLGTTVLTGLWQGVRQAWRRRTHQALTATTGRVEHALWSTPFLQLRDGAVRVLLFVAFLPYEALLMLDAITMTLVRLYMTRRHLLQWTTAAHTVRLFGDDVRAVTTWREMLPATLLVATLVLAVSMARPAALLVAVPFFVVWFLASQIAYVMSQPRLGDVYTPSADEVQRLRTLARRTWLFYEQFVGPDDNWLPPDHFQEAPRSVVAQRTSPTNVGLYVLSLLAAHDLGYISASDYVLRLRFTFDTLARLERYRGHFLNWIDTHTLAPLLPRYVSTVDSGNLAACLIVLQQGCLALPRQPVWRWEMWEGFLDTLSLLRETIRDIQEAGAPLGAVLEEMRQQILALRTEPAQWAPLLAHVMTDRRATLHRYLLQYVETAALDAETLRTCRIIAERIDAHLTGMQRQIAQVLPWLDPAQAEASMSLRGLPEVKTIPAWAELPGLYATLLARLEPAPRAAALIEQIRRAQQTVQTLLADLDTLAAQAGGYVASMDFGFLFDPQRQTFHIGSNLDSGRLDANYYDLLASEARLASLVAIAKQDVPQRHWLHLGRPLTRASNGATALLSWSATMFEYLMPCLLVRHYADTLLDTSCRAAVAHQIAYGRQQGVPWGVSESGFYAFDPALNYQYQAFGVPGLGFKRGLSDDLVITPYASLLALPYAPQAVLQNMTRLTELGGGGRYGFYEALDFTPARLQLGQNYAVVRSYMAHHQGMILLALSNYLQGDRMIDRMHAAPAIQSVELLLQEQVVPHASLQFPHEEERHALPLPPGSLRRPPAAYPWRVDVQTPLPLVHVLANGRFTTFITNSGSGYSQFKDIALTRWRSDTTLDDWGLWLYLQDLDRGTTWTASAQPLGEGVEPGEVWFHPHMAEFRRRDHDISLHVEITVAPDDDVEIRRLTLTNDSDAPRALQLTTYGEVVLAPLPADQRHPAFTKLFVESTPLPAESGLLFRRRPRSAHEQPYCLGHLLVMPPQGGDSVVTWESDRARFLGRHRTPRQPQALETDLSNTTGATLDPVMALRTVLTIPSRASLSLAVLTLAAEDRATALHLAQRYHAWETIDRAFLRAHASAEQELHRLGLDSHALEQIQPILSGLLYPHAALRAEAAVLATNSKGQAGLWTYGISGDYPILLVCIDDESAGDFLQSVLQAHMYWRRRGVQVDLVLLNQQETGYGQELQGFIFRLLRRMNNDEWLNQRGGIFVLRHDQLPEADRVLLLSAARVVLHGDRGSLTAQTEVLAQSSTPLPTFVPTQEVSPQEDMTLSPGRPDDGMYDNGYGSFRADGREYVVYRTPPAPWSNVIANPYAGFLISDGGGGYTWAGNSGENRLTTWRNDPVSDQPAEVIYLRDEETAALWSATPQPAGAGRPYLVRHGAGYTIFQHQRHHLRHELRLFMAPDAPVKLLHLRLDNLAAQPRRLTVTFYAEWVLGVERATTQQYLIPTYDEGVAALLAQNPYSAEFGNAVAFVAASKPPHGLTTNRTEFLGRLGSLQRPQALQRIGLAGSIAAGGDPCAAFQVHLDLTGGGSADVTFLLGQGADRTAALELVKRFQTPAQVQQAWQATHQTWDDILGAVQVQTPDPAMNLLLNRWLLYQTLSCRFWGRAALYQSSGAFGFRDQLQDVMALLHTRPDLARAHILEAARHQFEAGDVLHWWHPPGGNGVRTRISDDLLWLPFVTAHYVETTGDTAILAEAMPFLAGTPLGVEEEDRYGHFASTAASASLFDHCRRALARGATRGPHGLPLIGAGDWNDGMNRVGIGGKGESVWLGWFLLATYHAFAALCERLDQPDEARLYRQQATELDQALAAHAWDGAWYRRAWYDDGTPLGSQQSRECQIDAIAQAWAVLSGAAPPERARQAMRSVLERLVQRDARLMLLLTPPFDQTQHDPGYIKGYLPGIRENGGQYTHAALWTIWAFAQLGDGDLATELFRLVNPIWRSATTAMAERYQVEPYVISADVYSVAPHTGRGGWTWYTGSAGWMYRLGLEALLGVQRQGTNLRLRPHLPRRWQQVSLTYRYGTAIYHIRIETSPQRMRGESRVSVDGTEVADGNITLHNDGISHQVVVSIG